MNAYQTEGAQHREALNISQSQLHQTQRYNESIKTIPRLLEVVVRIHSHKLEKHLSCKDPSEHLAGRREIIFVQQHVS